MFVRISVNNNRKVGIAASDPSSGISPARNMIPFSYRWDGTNFPKLAGAPRAVRRSHRPPPAGSPRVTRGVVPLLALKLGTAYHGSACVCRSGIEFPSGGLLN